MCSTETVVERIGSRPRVPRKTSLDPIERTSIASSTNGYSMDGLRHATAADRPTRRSDD